MSTETQKVDVMTFGMPLTLRSSLENGDAFERSSAVAYRHFKGEVVYLVGWETEAYNGYTITRKLGSDRFEHISGHPFDLFEPAALARVGGAA